MIAAKYVYCATMSCLLFVPRRRTLLHHPYWSYILLLYAYRSRTLSLAWIKLLYDSSTLSFLFFPQAFRPSS